VPSEICKSFLNLILPDLLTHNLSFLATKLGHCIVIFFRILQSLQSIVIIRKQVKSRFDLISTICCLKKIIESLVYLDYNFNLQQKMTLNSEYNGRPLMVTLSGLGGRCYSRLQ
jgi:hypothetical protein